MTADEFFRLNAELKDAELRVYLCLMVLNPFQNSVIEIDTSHIAEQLGLTRRTVQRAVKRLCELQLIEIEITKFKYKKAVHGASSRLKSSDNRIATDDNRIVSSDPIVATDDTRIVSSDNRIATTPVKALPDKDSSTPQINNTYLDFIDSLSEEEREDFLKFGESEATQLTNPPIRLPRAWIKEHWEDLASRWYKSKGKTPPTQTEKWKNHPQRQEWIDKIRALGFAAFIYESGSQDSERQQFYEWASSQNLIWVDGS
ncbi:helix-turn-helix domain-containing protein [Nostoc sp. FACHB-190]|uniref:helix-turn-helix domain-containing protein n=1 Tax=Nostoc sp. FACHB-190 TaxID=2692838 RepID=UPI001A7E242A|nr:HTH domain-containing protein [Nostoc sp. FACHB-190]